MGHLIIAIGQAGCGILNSLLSHRRNWKLEMSDIFAINSDHVDFQRANKIPMDKWIGISEKKKDAITIEDAKTQGVGFADLIAGGYGNNAEAASKDAEIIAPKLVEKMMDMLPEKRKDSINLILVIFSLGGGTGAGFGPAVVKELKKKHKYVIPLVIYPSISEGKQRHENAIISLKNLYSTTNTSIIFDNNILTRRKKGLGLADFKIPNWILAECIETMLFMPSLLSSGDANTPVFDYKDFCTVLGLNEREEYIGCFGISLYIYNLLEALLRKPFADLNTISRDQTINSIRRKMLIIDKAPEKIGVVIATKEKLYTRIKRDLINNKINGEVRRLEPDASDIKILEGFISHNTPSIRYVTLQTYFFDDFKNEKEMEI